MAVSGVLSVAAGLIMVSPSWAVTPASAAQTPGTPCSTLARACADISDAGMQAWLINNGEVTAGPFPISTGTSGHPTPTGVFSVRRKVKDEVSRLTNPPSPMPWSVYFTDDGSAFHAGDVDVESLGCIHLEPGPAQLFFETLHVGDRVEIVG